MQQLYEVTDWLNRVDCLQEDAKEIIKEAEEEIRNKALRRFCPKNCCSYNGVGKRVSEKRKEVTELTKDGEFDAVVKIKPGDLVIQMPVPETLGLDSKLEEIWRRIEDPSVGIIGSYGMEGAAKTALLKEIYNKIEVECLPPELALQLFQFSVGGETLNAHWEISMLAEEVADVCKGLPLSLTTIGRAMASKTKLGNWKLAIEKLKTQPSAFPDVEVSVFSVLKISYDSLSTDAPRNCFLYFSLFPGVDNIKKKELIELWIAEGFQHKFNSMYDAREEEEDTLESLKSASLLESGKSGDFVKKHGVIQAMTLWLAREEGKEEDKVLVQVKTLQLSICIKAERISLWGPSIEFLPKTPSCHHLTTLLLRANNLKILPSEFFQSMPALRVLDLSYNKGLIELPVGIGNLRNLRYLNLSGTCIEILPVEVQNLKKLQSLILDGTLLQLLYQWA
ncbi:hypothetical protein P3X46_001223 [Hevea brasiliensis]|uniref:NB-ARC domain-containing protein n=1 Tax=Hevea brasiliensis TaxID=3981 RepID=A0ABQ9NH74_HEVBR|nr:disease resistance protein RFL1-like [Hevea brasiliensis]KAJ9189984.1 hypothetical protein P3X46_001223 [Hevea brasiliensis]